MKLFLAFTLLVSSVVMAQNVDAFWENNKKVRTIVKKSYPTALNTMNQSYKNINIAMDSALETAKASCENAGWSFAALERSEKESYVGGGNYSWEIKAVVSCEK